MSRLQKSHRFEELDSLRGVAAMTVVFYHTLGYWKPPFPAWWDWILASPLSLLFSGTDAVLLFFVLSGFVLFLPYMTSEGPPPYPNFAIKRICRIYLPYLAALAFSVCVYWYNNRPVDAATHDAVWNGSFPVKAILLNIALVGPSDAVFAFNGVFWSLVYEMRLSFAFPIIALLAMRLPLGKGLVLGFCICGLGLIPLLSRHYDWATIGYAGLFLVGASMARHLDQIRGYAARIGPYGRGLVFVLALILLKSMHVLPLRFKTVPTQATIHGAATALIVILALTTSHFKSLLHMRVLRWLGRVSYSLYLIHLPMLWLLVHVFWNRTEHHGWLLVAGVGSTLLMSSLFYRWVERPSMLLGRRLGASRRRVDAELVLSNRVARS